MKIAKEAMKRQFDKKRWNSQGLKIFFFLNQQFIIQHAEVDHGSYFIATYKRTILYEGKGTERKRDWEKETES